MKRSAINQWIKSASKCFRQHGWILPPRPRWDVTDFGLGHYQRYGLVLVNLAEEKEYCEKLMYARKNMVTPSHCHHKKKEDIISRWGVLKVRVWAGKPSESKKKFTVQVNGEKRKVSSGSVISLKSGERITLVPRVYHEFWPSTKECIIGEVSTANDDLHDNFFVNPNIGRYPGIEEDQKPLLRLLSEK